MPWHLFWTSLVQVVIALPVMTLLASFLVWMVTHARTAAVATASTEARDEKIL